VSPPGPLMERLESPIVKQNLLLDPRLRGDES
jgi:hypothetical protein